MPRRRRTRSELELIISAQVDAAHEELLRGSLLLLRSGDGNSLEEDARRFLADTRRQAKVTQEDPGDYLSDEQYILRKTKEIYTDKGVPDSGLIVGLYRRAYNPMFGKRPTSSGGSSDDG